MDRPTRHQLLWRVLGLVCYLFGMLLFLVIAVDVYFSPPEHSLENITGWHMGYIGVSVLLIVLGRVVSWKFGGEIDLSGAMGGHYGQPGVESDPGPEQSTLEQMGYRLPPESGDGSDSNVVYEDGTVYAVCTECGAKNEREYKYCGNCGSGLPE